MKTASILFVSIILNILPLTQRKQAMQRKQTLPRRDFLAASVSATCMVGVAQAGFFSSTPSKDDSRKLGVALVGLGSLSTNQIAPALQRTANCRLAAIVTGTPEKEKRWAEQYGIPTGSIYNYENFDKIASDENVDVVYVVLPNSMHHEYTIRAAKAGKHVLCEKPMANTAQECREMIAACKAANRQLAIGYRCQFTSHHLHLQAAVRDKAIGDLKMLEAGFGFKIGDPNQWRLKKALAGGGALMDVGIYALQACRFLTGQEPTSIMAQETKTDEVKFAEVDESITWMMKFPGDISAYCSTSYNFNGLNKVIAYGGNGMAKMDPAYSYSGLQLEINGRSVELAQQDHFAAEMDDFAACIRENRPSKVSGEEGLKDLLAIEAIYKSIESRASVEVQKV
jgi:predicted dehydrogenase